MHYTIPYLAAAQRDTDIQRFSLIFIQQTSSLPVAMSHSNSKNGWRAAASIASRRVWQYAEYGRCTQKNVPSSHPPLKSHCAMTLAIVCTRCRTTAVTNSTAVSALSVSSDWKETTRMLQACLKWAKLAKKQIIVFFSIVVDNFNILQFFPEQTIESRSAKDKDKDRRLKVALNRLL